MPFAFSILVEELDPDCLPAQVLSESGWLSQPAIFLRNLTLLQMCRDQDPNAKIENYQMSGLVFVAKLSKLCKMWSDQRIDETLFQFVFISVLASGQTLALI